MNKGISITLIFLLFIGFTTSAQQNYQSLFWEITSPTQESPSYLYGTMHVSNKIAYHLSDEFYNALQKVDYVALESDPMEWLEAFEDGRMAKEYNNSSEYNDYSGFYRSFCPIETEEDFIKYYLSQDNQLINGILYRSSMYEADFQEETYLDMFIYQTGKKYDKKFTGLEDYDLSTDMVNAAMLYAEYNDDLAPWLTKLLQEKNYVQLMEDAYRDQDLDFLDSLNNEFNNEEYNKFMITDRNELMANSIDSVIQLGSIFAGVGAAHLPGDLGVIEMLRDRGYTLKPINGQLTSKGKQLRTSIDNKFNVKPFEEQFSSDSMFRVQWLNKIYEFSNGVLVSPDLTNGAYVLISRLNKHQHFYNEGICNLATIDKFLFENVPGDIISKKEIINGGFKGIDLINKTKNGNHQRYHIYETPLEVIIFKMDGPQKYVLEHGDAFFDDIWLKPVTSNKKKIQSNFNSFSVNLPAYYKIENNGGFASRIDYPYVQSFDVSDSSYYFIVTRALTDYTYLEEDKFEEKMIHKRVYEKLELDGENFVSNQFLTSKAPVVIKDSIPTGDTIYLETILSNNQYYLLGYYGKSALKASTFFSSFSISDYTFSDELKEIEDTLLHYTVTTFNDPPYHHLRDMFSKKEQENKNIYEAENQIYYYNSPSKEKVKLYYTKFPLYEYYENIDSLWSHYSNRNGRYNNSFGGNYSAARAKKRNPAALQVIKKKTGKLDGKYPYMDIHLAREGSSKYVKKRYILNHGVMYSIVSMQDSLVETSVFVNTFYNTFMPKDTVIGFSPFEDKTDMFLEDVTSLDTLRKEAALESINSIELGKEYLSQLFALIDTFPFTEEEQNSKANLITKVGQINTPTTDSYLIDLYKRSEFNSIVQMAIIRSFANEKTEENSKIILELLDHDIPLAYQYVIYNAFRSYNDSLELAEPLFPDLLKYGNITEYQSLVFGLLAGLRSEKGYNAKKYKKHKEMLITDGRIELKRLKQKELQGERSYYGGNSNNVMLNIYITLLAPYYNESAVKNLFDKINTVDDVSTLAHLALTQMKEGNHYDMNVLRDLLEDPGSINDIAEAFLEAEKPSVLEDLNISQKDIAIAELYDAADDEIKEYEILLEEKMTLNEQDFNVYIFKYKIESEDSYNYYGNNDKWIMGAVSYLIPEDSKVKLQAYPYYQDLSTYNTVLIEDDEEEQKEFVDKCKDSIQYLGRKRVQVVEVNYGY